jgi:hypothetical protein
MTITAIDLPMEAISKLGDRWQVIEFAPHCLVSACLIFLGTICYFLQSARCIYTAGQPDLEKIES